jgi:hypothetical protein
MIEKKEKRRGLERCLLGQKPRGHIAVSRDFLPLLFQAVAFC